MSLLHRLIYRGNLRHKGLARITATDPITHQVIKRVERRNLVVNLGKYLAGDHLIGAVTGGLSYCSYGTSSTPPAAGNTKLTAEAGRKAMTTKSRTGAVVTFSTFFLSTECTADIKEVGWFGGVASSTPDSGTLFNHALLAYDNSAGNVDLTIELELTIS